MFAPGTLRVQFFPGANTNLLKKFSGMDLLKSHFTKKLGTIGDFEQDT